MWTIFEVSFGALFDIGLDYIFNKHPRFAICIVLLAFAVAIYLWE